MKRIFVLGGASGIGREVVQRCLSDGASVLATFNGSLTARDEMLSEHPQNLEFINTDLSSDEDNAALADRLREDEAFDGAIFCAARTYDQMLPFLAQEEIADTFAINAISTIALVGVISRSMLRARSGSIVLVSSIASQRGNRGNSVYAATKGALEAFTRSAAQELGPRGVRINCLAPGFVNTRMLEKYGRLATEMTKQIPVRRFSEPEEVANVAVALLKPDFAYMNGATLSLDGGLGAGLNLSR